jgi:phosphoserine phosphatase RsbU/P
MQVLIAEDDAGSRLVLQKALEQLGHACLVACDGTEAWALFQRTEVDVVISDWMMPGLDGIELCRRVRASPRPLYPYFVLLTALADRSHLLAGLEAGTDDYLTKPLDRAELQVRLTAAARVTSLYRRLDEQHRRLEAELARAGAVQAELLPHQAPALPGFELAARCIPAREVGGDYDSWQAPVPGVLQLTVGDAMGKGMAAALLMATVRAAVRAAAHHAAPAAALDVAARALETDLERSGSFVTLFHAWLDVPARRLTFVDAGHGHVFVRRGDGTPVGQEPRGLPRGIALGGPYREGVCTLAPGDALVVYSDGLLDARPDVTLDPPAIAARLAGAESAQAMVDRLVELAALTGPPPDDLTVVVLRCRDEAWPGRGVAGPECALGRLRPPAAECGGQGGRLPAPSDARDRGA